VSKQIRVVLAEDQAMVLGALAALLEIEKDISVVARARNGREAMGLVAEHGPEVLITDIEMPEMSGLTLAAEVHSRYPRVHIVILTTFARAGYLRRAMDAGAQGYMLKDRPAAELADCVRRVCRGLRVVDPELAAEAWTQEPDPLSERERQILWRAGEGKSGAEIALDLHLSEGTVRNYLSEAINKLGAARDGCKAREKPQVPPLRYPDFVPDPRRRVPHVRTSVHGTRKTGRPGFPITGRHQRPRVRLSSRKAA